MRWLFRGIASSLIGSRLIVPLPKIVRPRFRHSTKQNVADTGSVMGVGHVSVRRRPISCPSDFEARCVAIEAAGRAFNPLPCQPEIRVVAQP